MRIHDRAAVVGVVSLLFVSVLFWGVVRLRDHVQRAEPVLVARYTARLIRPARFARLVIAERAGPHAREKAVGDLNGDGRPDVIVGSDSGASWYAQPAAHLAQRRWVRHVILPVGNFYEGIAVADFNLDGRRDVMLSQKRDLKDAGDDGPGSVSWQENPGAASAGPWKQHFVADGRAHELLLADIDGDGQLDAVTSRSRNVDFRSGQGWTAMPWGTGAAGRGLDGLALLDIGRGKGAINIVGANAGGIYWFENPRERGGNAREEKEWVAHRVGANDTGGPALSTADMNGDGRADIVQAPSEQQQGTQGLIWWQAPIDPRYGHWIKHRIDNSWQLVHRISVGDFNNDGHPDLLLTEQEQSHDPAGDVHFDNDRVAIIYSDGHGSFNLQVVARSGGHNQVAADFNRDGRLDFLNVNHGGHLPINPVELFLNEGTQ